MNSASTYTPDINSFYDAPNATGSPERRLLLAILERAILDYVGNDPREIQGSSDWLFSDDGENGREFTFVWVCEQLELDPKTIADCIQAMPKRGNHRIAPWYLTKNYANKEEHKRELTFKDRENMKRHSNSIDLGDALKKAS